MVLFSYFFLLIYLIKKAILNNFVPIKENFSPDLDWVPRYTIPTPSIDSILQHVASQALAGENNENTDNVYNSKEGSYDDIIELNDSEPIININRRPSISNSSRFQDSYSTNELNKFAFISSTNCKFLFKKFNIIQLIFTLHLVSIKQILNLEIWDDNLVKLYLRKFLIHLNVQIQCLII